MGNSDTPSCSKDEESIASRRPKRESASKFRLPVVPPRTRLTSKIKKNDKKSTKSNGKVVRKTRKQTKIKLMEAARRRKRELQSLPTELRPKMDQPHSRSRIDLSDLDLLPLNSKTRCISEDSDEALTARQGSLSYLNRSVGLQSRLQFQQMMNEIEEEELKEKPITLTKAKKKMAELEYKLSELEAENEELRLTDPGHHFAFDKVSQIFMKQDDCEDDMDLTKPFKKLSTEMKEKRISTLRCLAAFFVNPVSDAPDREVEDILYLAAEKTSRRKRPAEPLPPRPHVAPRLPEPIRPLVHPRLSLPTRPTTLTRPPILTRPPVTSHVPLPMPNIVIRPAHRQQTSVPPPNEEDSEIIDVGNYDYIDSIPHYSQARLMAPRYSQFSYEMPTLDTEF